MLRSVDLLYLFFFFSSRRRHTRLVSDWSSDVCSSDLEGNISIYFHVDPSESEHEERSKLGVPMDPNDCFSAAGHIVLEENPFDSGTWRVSLDILENLVKRLPNILFAVKVELYCANVGLVHDIR